MPKTKPVSFKEHIHLKDFPKLFHTQPLEEADLREIEKLNWFQDHKDLRMQLKIHKVFYLFQSA